MSPSLSVLQAVAVAPEETGASAFLAAEATGSVEEAGCKPFEADGHFPKLATEAGNDAIDETTADKRFADDCACRPLRAVGKEITDGDGEVMVWVQKTSGGSNDAVPVSVGIVAEGDVETVLKFDQACHRIGARAIHPDFSIVI